MYTIGTIPTGFGATMTALSTLSLHKNKLFGTIPPSLGNISYLVYFTANLNNLTGTLPDSLSVLTDLAEIRLDVNSLTGPLPESWGQIDSLTQLVVNYNSLTGSIPSAWCNMTNLVVFAVGYQSNDELNCYEECFYSADNPNQTQFEMDYMTDCHLSKLL